MRRVELIPGYNVCYYGSGKIPQVLVDHFSDRTNMHIDLVGKFCHLIADRYSEFSGLRVRASVHDDSKFVEPERRAYIFLSWRYRCERTGERFEDCKPPGDVDEMIRMATLHHVTTNSHHPEFHSPFRNDLINREDRDNPPDEIVDATSMPDLDVAEMVADWCAMGEELGTSAVEWAQNNVNKRWEFTGRQSNLIFDLLETISGVED